MKTISLFLAAALTAAAAQGAETDTRWGDLGDGTFANPVLNADYSDPDMIRVGDKYYLTCSEFHFMGMVILESDDMVNWKIVGKVFDSIDLPGYSSMEKYGGGTWAPALRYHDGKFWIFVCTPNEGLFMTQADKPEGPWTPLHCVKSASGWEDPCPLWDEDGNAWLGRSQLGAGPIYIHKMSTDGKKLLDNGKLVYEGPVAEGTKLFIRDGWYYMSIPEGGVGGGWQQVLRSKSIYGPWEGKTVLEQGSTNINGPHQGALVDTPDGEWWFCHFQSTGARGRVMHLQPVKWQEDGFPFIGEDYDGNGIGEPVKVCAKPNTGVSNKPSHPQTSDSFDGPEIGIQWQFNHNPDKSRLSLTERPGSLAIRPLKAAKARESRNQLTQKLMGYHSVATVKINFADMKVGDRAGLEVLGNKFMCLGVMTELSNGSPRHLLYTENNGVVARKKNMTSTGQDYVWLRADMDAAANKFQFYYSLDGEKFVKTGDLFEMNDGDWKGVRPGIYSYTTADDDSGVGTVYVESFDYDTDGPGLLGIGESGVENTVADVVADSIDIKVEGTTVAVDSTSTASVRFFTPDGRMALRGVTPGSFSLPSGLYLLSVCSPAASKTVKLALR